MSVYVCGDFHGALDISVVSGKRWVESRTLTKEDVLIQLGDFGLVWSKNPSDEDKFWIDWLNKKPYTFAFVDGNHENFDILEKYPTEFKWNGAVKRVAENIFWLQRGEIYSIDGKEILAMGGACSVDKHMRTTGVSYWKQEEWSWAEQEYIFNQALYNPIDIVVSHTCPTKVVTEVSAWPHYDSGCTVAKAMEELVKQGLKPKQWHFGHFHNNKKVTYQDIDFYCHYRETPFKL